jgi:peptidoglycan hydrolase-like protein with peptidoglycan-binding domain
MVGLYDGPIDGLYGPETQAAISRFQRTRHLAVTARMDSRTLAALREEAERSGEPIALSDPTQVRTVQNRLRQLGYYTGAADGVWGPEIQRSLERFQRDEGLPVGHVTRPTLIAMDLDVNAFPARANTLAASTEPLDPIVVQGIQHRLRELGFYSGRIDGVWGPATQNALMQFQRSRGIEPAGNINPITASALGLDPNNLSDSAAAVANGQRGRR